MDALAFLAASVSACLLLLHRLRARRPALHQTPAFAEKRRAIVAGGPSRVQLLLDFDRTLTTFDSESAYGVLEENQPESARQAARALFAKYYKIEINKSLSVAEKTPFMIEWYEQAHALFIAVGVTRAALHEACARTTLHLRTEVLELLRITEAAAIPVLIFSAGIADVIEEMLRLRLPGGRIPSNVVVVSNRMQWSADGRLVGWSHPLIHMFCKNESHLRATEIYDELCRRTHVVLVGDSVGDATMADGLPHEVVLKLGVINHRPEDYLEKFLQVFDAALVDNVGLEPLLALAQDIITAGKQVAPLREAVWRDEKL